MIKGHDIESLLKAIESFLKAEDKMARACGENVGGTDDWKNVEGEIVLQKKEGTTT